MASTKPKSVRALASPYEHPSPVVRGSTADDLTRARAHAREGNGGPPTVTGRDVEVAARAVVAAITRLAERREALAAMVIAARASQLSDAVIHGYLVVAGLEPADVEAALT